MPYPRFISAHTAHCRNAAQPRQQQHQHRLHSCLPLLQMSPVRGVVVLCVARRAVRVCWPPVPWICSPAHARGLTCLVFLRRHTAAGVVGVIQPQTQTQSERVPRPCWPLCVCLIPPTAAAFKGRRRGKWVGGPRLAWRAALRLWVCMWGRLCACPSSTDSTPLSTGSGSKAIDYSSQRWTTKQKCRISGAGAACSTHTLGQA
jgi:hypothetical protein